jgi:hypothetical protein
VGYGRNGSLGHGDRENQLAPRCVEALQVEWAVAVCAGFWPTGAVTHVSSVFGWGQAEALDLPDNVAVSEDVFGHVVILSPCRYPQLSCVRSS